MALHPVGPLPASTYWRRRLVLTVLLVALVLLVKSCAGGGSGRATLRTGASPSPSAPPTASATPTPSRAPVKAAVGTCPDAALSLVASSDASSYAVGTTPRFTLTVKNVSRTACRRDLGAGMLEVLVYSGPDRIWSSDDCSTDKSIAVTRLAPGQVLQTAVLWPGRRSSKGCPSPGPAARPGTYTVRGRLGTLPAVSAVFQLHS